MSSDKSSQKRLTHNFGDLNQEIINQLVNIQILGASSAPVWQQFDEICLTETEQLVLDYLVSGVADRRPSIMNEATIWSRLNYPLLQLAESELIQAWSEVWVKADLPHVTLQGVIDGVLGHTLSGLLQVPWFVIVEAKKGIGNRDPQAQLYGQLLATAHTNQQSSLNKHMADEELGGHSSSLYGCYTVADDWTFVHAQIIDLHTAMPTMKLAFSPEYTGRLEADKIVKILKRIIQSHQHSQ